MNASLPFLAIGLLLVVLLILLVSRARRTGPAPFESPDDPWDGFLWKPFRQAVAVRLFGPEDWDFVAKQGSARVRRLFLEQRTVVALSWLRCVRADANKLLRVHSRSARESSQLEPLVELRIVAEYLIIQTLCRLLGLVIWLRGPVDLSRFVSYVDDLSAQLSESISRFLSSELTGEISKHDS